MNILTDEELKATLDKVSCCLEDRDIAYSRAVEAAVLSKLAEQDVEPVVIEEPDYHYEAMGCGLEDRNITDRYEAMRHGWNCAIERMFEQIPDEPLYTEAQLLAAQQRTAEACAKAAYKQAVARGGYNTIADDVRDATVSDWREYL